jgi:Rhs element Vgr protein
MTNPRVIPTNRSQDMITHTILINGAQIPRTVQVKMITIIKEVNRISMAKVVLLDGDVAESDFRNSNGNLFVPGNEIEIQVGYHSDESSLFKGIIIKHGIKIRSNGSSVLILECKDKAVKMTIGRHNKYFYDVKDSDVFEEMISRHGLNPEVDDTQYTHPALVQYDATDWDFMISRVELNGKFCFNEDGKIIIKKPDMGQDPVEDLVFGATIRDFDAEIDARNQLKAVSAFGWDPANQELLEMEASNPALEFNGNLSATELANVIGLEKWNLSHGGAIKDAELQSWSDAKMFRNQLSKVQGRVRFQGVGRVMPGTIINLSGVGDRFNGKVLVTGTKHTIAEGDWQLDAQFGLDPEWFSHKTAIVKPQASGVLPAIHGLQIGIVTQLEEDPEGENRIMVRMPLIDPQEQGLWARVANPDAGNERGIYFRPEIGDEVVVGFLNDDPRHAIVLGMLHSSAKPAPFTASDENHEKGIVTRSKMKMTFDDDKKSVILETPAGKMIKVDEDAGVVELSDENGNKFVMDSGGISIESNGDINIKAAGNLSVEGTNVTHKASAQFKAEGSGGAEVSTSAVAVLKGSLVQIN